MSNLSAASEGFGAQHLRRGLTFVVEDAKPARAGRSAWLASALLGFACFMTVVMLLASRGGPMVPEPDRVVPPAPPAEPLPAWVEITRPFATFDLAGGPFAKLPLRYEAMRDQNGTARQDVITHGTPQPGDPFARILFYRHGGEPVGETTLFVDAARVAGAAGLAVIRSGLAASLPTRFGDFETAGVSVSRGGRSSPCLAFRRDAAVLSIAGVICGAEAKPVDLQALACTLDKLDLVGAGDDAALRDMFVAAERQRGLGCLDARTSRTAPTDPLRPISNALRGSLPLSGAPGGNRQLSGSR